MSTLIIIVHTIVAIALILIVLLQTGKGADMGAAFGGGGSQTLFGSSGASTFLSRLTTIAAVVFMLTSLSLAYFSGQRQPSSIVTDMPAPVTEPAEEAVPQAPVQTEDAAPEAAVPAEEAPPQTDAGPAGEAPATDAAPAQSESSPPAQSGSAADEAAGSGG